MSDPNNPYGQPSGDNPYGQQPDPNNPYGQPSGDNPYGQQPPSYGQQPPSYGQSDPYGQPPPSYGQSAPYGAQTPYGGGYGSMAEKHPQSVTVLVLGILGLICCSILAPIAWVMGSKAVKEIDASPGRYEGRDLANVGKILGIIGTVLLVVSIVAFVVLFAGGMIAAETTTYNNSNF